MQKLTLWMTTLLFATVLIACGDDTASSGSDGGPSSTGAGAGSGGAGSGSGPGGSTSATGGGGSGAAGGAPGNGACAYPGIPHPTDMLPSGIMPALPTPASQPGFPYDPCALDTPAPSGAANEWVVSVSGDDASAGNGGQGTEAAPRRSVPTGTFGPGTKIFIIGQSSPYGTVDFEVGDEVDWEFGCTADDLCWVVGIDSPRMGRRFDIANSAHLLIDGVSIVDIVGGGRPWGNLRFTNSQYITLRNSEIRGSGENSRGGSVVSMANVEFFVTFQVDIHHAGSWDSNATDLDVHGWRPSYGNRYLWLLDSELHHLQADGVQTGNSSNPNPQSETSHYVFIGGNSFYENYENALDNKNSYHVVFSSNDVHDFYAAPDASGANGTAIILSNNSEGPWTGYHWAINNRVWNTSLAIRDSGSETDEYNFAVGNLIWNANTAFVQANNSQNRELWVIHNTVHGSTTAFDMFQPGNNASLFIRANIFADAGGLDTMSQPTSVLSNNILFNTSADGQWDTQDGTLNEDPLLSSPDTGDMTFDASSVAIDAVSEDPIFALFSSLYGLDIRLDRNGTARPQASGWDIGAIEAP